MSSQAQQEGIDLTALLNIIGDTTTAVKNKIEDLKSRTSSISIKDMFEMQMKMNHLTQLSEMSTAVVAGAHGAIIAMTRNIK